MTRTIAEGNSITQHPYFIEEIRYKPSQVHLEKRVYSVLKDMKYYKAVLAANWKIMAELMHFFALKRLSG